MDAILDELLARKAERFVPAKPFILLYTALGDIDRALDALENAYEQRAVNSSQGCRRDGDGVDWQWIAALQERRRKRRLCDDSAVTRYCGVPDLRIGSENTCTT